MLRKTLLAAFGLFIVVTNPWVLARPTKAAKKSATEGQAVAQLPSAADELVETAFEATLDGDAEGRILYLREALEQDPQNPVARWQLGQVNLRGNWAPVDEVAAVAARDRRLKEYQEQRVAASDSAADQFALASWCKELGLMSEARAHLLAAIDRDPSLGPQAGEFGLTNVQGQMLTDAQVRRQQSQVKRDQILLKKWKPKIALLSKQLQSKELGERIEADSQLRALRDPALVPAIEAVFSTGKHAQPVMAIAMLRQIPGERAALSLVQHALLSPSPEIRKLAAEALEQRSLFSYAPLLLSSLEAPIGARFDNISQDGSPTYRLSLFREGAVVDSLATQDLQFFNQLTVTPGRDIDQNKLQAAQDKQRLDERAIVNDMATRVAASITANNAQIQQWNQRVGSALKAAAKVPESERPRDYWQWWYDYNDIYYPPERPVEQIAYNPVTVYQSSDVSITPPPPPRPRRSVECFVAGTMVSTSVGPREIESIRGGDCVLAQDVETGELSFKPVLSTSVRPPTDLLVLKIGAETITATRGHPVWVVGEGWKMAKELAVGDRVYTLTGPMAVTSIEPGPRAEAYNLVVADFNTFFVGKLKLLAHDNTLRRATDAVVPGYVVVK